MYFLVYNKCNELVLFSQIKGYKNSGNGIELPLEMFYALWILKAFVYNVPVYNVPIIFNVFRTSVLGVQIVSVFPDINCQHGFLSMFQWSICITGLYDFQFTLFVHNQPGPS